MTDVPANSPSFWRDRIAGSYHAHGGLGGAAKAGLGDIKNIVGKDVTLGQRGVGFARVTGVGAGLAIAAGSLRSQTVDGEDRSMLARLGQAVLGLGVAAGSLIVGKGR